MALEARLSKQKRNSLIIYAVVCLAIAIWFTYDGYYSPKFIQKNTENGKPNSTLVFNQKGPYFLFAGAMGFGVYLFLIRNKKVVLEENRLIVDKKMIDCDSIEKIDKTFFDTKGYFVLTYKNQAGVEQNIKIGDNVYEDLEPILEHLIAKIS